MGARGFYVYILASRIGGTLYIGVTNDLARRVAEHKSKTAGSFTKQYGVDRMVYFEGFDWIEQALHREKRLKKWPRAWRWQHWTVPMNKRALTRLRRSAQAFARKC